MVPRFASGAVQLCVASGEPLKNQHGGNANFHVQLVMFQLSLKLPEPVTIIYPIKSSLNHH